MSSDLHAQDRVLVMAHRGGRGLWPENTLHAYRQAVDAGADVLELDIWQTKDGVIVVHHDERVDRTTDGRGAIRDLTVEELRALDAGYRWSVDGTWPYRGAGHVIPTLDEVLSEFPDTQINIDIKANVDSLVDTLCDLIDRHDAHERVIVGSFHGPAIRRFRHRCPRARTAAGFSEALRFLLLHKVRLTFLYTPPFEVLQVPLTFGPLDVVTGSFVRTANAKGVQVHPWTINDPDEMRRLVDLGVDGIITDYPDRLVEILKNR